MNDNITNVDPMDSTKKNSGMTDSLSGETTVILGDEKSRCYWNGTEFSEGSVVDDGGVTYKCHMGLWVKS